MNTQYTNMKVNTKYIIINPNYTFKLKLHKSKKLFTNQQLLLKFYIYYFDFNQQYNQTYLIKFNQM